MRPLAITLGLAALVAVGCSRTEPVVDATGAPVDLTNASFDQSGDLGSVQGAESGCPAGAGTCSCGAASGSPACGATDNDLNLVSAEGAEPEEPKCCGKDGKCCKEGDHTHAVSLEEPEEPKCCGKDGKCCKEGDSTLAVSLEEPEEPKCCGKDGKCCKEGADHDHDHAGHDDEADA
ncbi:MAG: hypothetical protein AAGB00_02705 [Planctomycetota bacterium]